MGQRLRLQPFNLPLRLRRLDLFPCGLQRVFELATRLMVLALFAAFTFKVAIQLAQFFLLAQQVFLRRAQLLLQELDLSIMALQFL